MPAGSKIEDFDYVEAAVMSAIKARIERCKQGIEQWWTVVKNAKCSDLITWYEKLSIQWKCQYMVVELEEAQQKMGSLADSATWKDYCPTAAKHLAKIKIFFLSNQESISIWYPVFRDKTIPSHIPTQNRPPARFRIHHILMSSRRLNLHSSQKQNNCSSCASQTYRILRSTSTRY